MHVVSNANIISYIRLDNAHTGVYLANKLADSLKEFGVDKKVRLHKFS